MLYLQIASPKSSVLNFLDSNSFEVIISIFQRTEKVPDMERLQNTCAEVNNKFCIFIKTVINVVFMKNTLIFYVSKLINFIKFEIL